MEVKRLVRTGVGVARNVIENPSAEDIKCELAKKISRQDILEFVKAPKLWDGSREMIPYRTDATKDIVDFSSKNLWDDSQEIAELKGVGLHKMTDPFNAGDDKIRHSHMLPECHDRDPERFKEGGISHLLEIQRFLARKGIKFEPVRRDIRYSDLWDLPRHRGDIPPINYGAGSHDVHISSGYSPEFFFKNPEKSSRFDALVAELREKMASRGSQRRTPEDAEPYKEGGMRDLLEYIHGLANGTDKKLEPSGVEPLFAPRHNSTPISPKDGGFNVQG